MEIFQKRSFENLVGESFFRPPPNSAQGLGSRGEGSHGVAGGRGRVLENTIAYFAQKVYWKVGSFQEKEKN